MLARQDGMDDLGNEGGDLARLLAAVRQSARYRRVSPALILAIGRRELATGRGLKEAIKATKGRLHQVCGAFQEGEPRYDAWIRELEAAAESGDAGAFRGACATIMRCHASTRERLPLLDRFYAETIGGLPPPRSVLDLGCGLHPLAIPWMGLPPGVVYRCYDVDAELIDFLNRFFALIGIDGRAEVRDLAANPPHEEADLALALKLLPTLDHLARAAGAALLRALRASHILVSFPAHSLGGRQKGMARHYEARFGSLLAAEGMQARRITFPTELVFLVDGARADPMYTGGMEED
jgi:16S rRNA (guanine(1405)-N(7))-methyltransferase